MKVGIAKTDITPRWPVWQDGFAARTRAAQGLDRAVEAMAVVFDNGSTRLGLMAIDICAVDDYLLVPVREAAAELGIPAAAMMVNTSHTHAGPNVSRIRGFCREFGYRYLEEVIDKLVALLATAEANLEDANLAYSTSVSTMGISRRGHISATAVTLAPSPVTASAPIIRAMPATTCRRGSWAARRSSCRAAVATSSRGTSPRNLTSRPARSRTSLSWAMSWGAPTWPASAVEPSRSLTSWRPRAR